MGRAPCCDKTKVKRGPWSPEEDNTLKNYVEKYGTGGNWIALPQKAGLKRCGKSCRLRWLNYLRPNIKHGGFTEEEDNIILTLYHSIGSRWSVIASQLPGRTDNDVKNYWNTKLKKKLFAVAGKANSSSSFTTNISGAAASKVAATTSNFNTGRPTSSVASVLLHTIYSRNSKINSNDICCDHNNNMSPYFPMELNCQQDLVASEIPPPGLMEAPARNLELNAAYNCGLFHYAQLGQEANLSGGLYSPSSFSMDSNNPSSSASWSNNGSGEEGAFLAEMGSGFDLDQNASFDDDQSTINHVNFGYSLAEISKILAD